MRKGRSRVWVWMWQLLLLVGLAMPLAAQPPSGEYGDAPDGVNALYPPPFANVVGRFPTSFNTANSRYGKPGGHAAIGGQE